MYTCMRVRTQVCVCVSVYVCECMHMRVHGLVCVRVRVCLSMLLINTPFEAKVLSGSNRWWSPFCNAKLLCMCVHACVCVCVCVYLCV